MWVEREKTRLKKPMRREKLRHSAIRARWVLRAYANRAMVLAFLCVPYDDAGARLRVYVRMQPPTVIMSMNGMATILGVNKSSCFGDARALDRSRPS